MNRNLGLLPGRVSYKAASLLPLVRHLARVRGVAFLISWCHRLSGLILLFFLVAHIWTLSSLSDPALYDAKMRIFSFFLLAFLEWALALPVIFHALNGGRLILYEGFGVRDDRVMLRWLLSLSLAYMALLGWAMLRGDQSVSPSLFWLGALLLAGFAASGAATRFWAAPQRLGWRLQRISGALLMVLVPAHMFFMHLAFPLGHDSQVVLQRLQSPFIKGVDLLLLGAVLFHGGYGAFSVLGDYLGSRVARAALGVFLTALVLFLAWTALGVLFGVKGGSVG